MKKNDSGMIVKIVMRKVEVFTLNQSGKVETYQKLL